MLAVTVLLAFLVATDAWKRFLLIAVLVLVMVVELLNTSIEKLADRSTTRSIRRLAGSRTSARPPSGSR